MPGFDLNRWESQARNSDIRPLAWVELSDHLSEVAEVLYGRITVYASHFRRFALPPSRTVVLACECAEVWMLSSMPKDASRQPNQETRSWSSECVRWMCMVFWLATASSRPQRRASRIATIGPYARWRAPSQRERQRRWPRKGWSPWFGSLGRSGAFAGWRHCRGQARPQPTRPRIELELQRERRFEFEPR